MTYESNAYLLGDEQHYLIVENRDVLYEGSGGYNVTWDYSYLVGGDSLTSYMLDATQQSGHEHFPEANIAIREDEKVAFFNVSSQGMADYGFIQSNSIYKYEMPIRRFSYPFVFGKELKGSYTSEKIGLSESKSTGVYSSEIDGTGKLILPGNIIIDNVLRVRTSQTKDSTGVTYVAYRWYSQNSDPITRYPLLSIITRETASGICISKAAYYADAQQFVEQAPTKFESIALREFTSPEALMLKIKVYPNPFVEKATVEYELPEESKVTIIVADGLGRKVETLVDRQQKEGHHTVEFEKGRGYYFVYYIITIVDEKVVSSKKLFHVNRY
jgi:hypothetical protein